MPVIYRLLRRCTGDDIISSVGGVEGNVSVEGRGVGGGGCMVCDSAGGQRLQQEQTLTHRL